MHTRRPVTICRCSSPSPRSDSGAVHLAAPGAGLAALLFDELAEALQVALHPAVDHAQLVAGRLDQALRVVVHLDGDPGVLVVEAVEGDDPGLLLTVGGLPRHPLVRDLLGDLGVELTLDPADL